jgi:hypothetical protein
MKAMRLARQRAPAKLFYDPDHWLHSSRRETRNEDFDFTGSPEEKSSFEPGRGARPSSPMRDL